MAQIVPPIPYKSPLTNDSGYLSQPWSMWIRDLFSRIGGLSALSNTELESLATANVASLQASITSLTASVSALTTSVNALTIRVSAKEQEPTA